MASPVIRAQFGDIEQYAKKIAEPGDNQALSSTGSQTTKSQFDQAVQDLYDAVDELTRTYQGPDAEELKRAVDAFRPSFASMSLTMASHADYLRHYCASHRRTQQGNIENTSVMGLDNRNKFNNAG